MKVLLVNGSPHKNGDTALMLTMVEKSLNEQGIETTWFQLGKQPVRGCIDCQGCKDIFRCVFKEDGCNKLIEGILAADGVVIGSPVYFAGPNGALCALLDRVFFAGSHFGRLFSGKPAAAVVGCWRAGATASIDRLNKYFSFSEMPIVSSHYWTMKHVGEDSYGEEIMTRLGINMGKMLKMIA